MERSVLLTGVILTGVALLLVGAAGALPADEEGFPRAEAGLDQTVERDSAVLLDATESFDPDGEIVAFDWAITAPDGSTLAPDCDVSSCRLASFRAAQLGEYAVTLTVTDDDGRERSDTMYVRTVVPGDFGVELTASGSRGDRTLTARVAPGRYDVDALAWYHEGTLIEREDVPVFGGVFTLDVAPDPGDRYRTVATAESGRTVADSWVAPSAGSGSGGGGGGLPGGGDGGGGSGGGGAPGGGGGDGSGPGSGIDDGDGDVPGVGNETDGGGGDGPGSSDDGNTTDSAPDCPEGASTNGTDCDAGGVDEEETNEEDEESVDIDPEPYIEGPTRVTGEPDEVGADGVWVATGEAFHLRLAPSGYGVEGMWTVDGNVTSDNLNAQGMSYAPPLTPGRNVVSADLQIEEMKDAISSPANYNGTIQGIINQTNPETTARHTVVYDPAPELQVDRIAIHDDERSLEARIDVEDKYNPVERIDFQFDGETATEIDSIPENGSAETEVDIPDGRGGYTLVAIGASDGVQTTWSARMMELPEERTYSIGQDSGVDVDEMDSEESSAGGTAPIRGGNI